MDSPQTTPGTAATVWIGETPPREVWDEIRTVRSRLGLEYPNNDSQRFIATCDAIAGARAVVIRIPQTGDTPAFLLGRAAKRRGHIRLGFARVQGPAVSTVDVVRGGLIAEPGTERTALRDALAELDSRGFRRVVFHAVPDGSALDLSLRGERRVLLSGSQDRHWLRMDPEGASAMSHRSSKTRSKLKRYSKLLDEAFGGDVSLEVVTRPEQVGAFCAACQTISEASYHEKIGYGVRDNPLWRSMLEAAAGGGHLRSYLLRCGGEPVAYQNGSIYGSTYFSDGKGFARVHSEHRPGTVLLWRMLEDLHPLGVRRVDFGLGESEYKKVFGNEESKDSQFTVFGSGTGARLALSAARALLWIRAVLARLSASRFGKKVRSRLVRAHKKGTSGGGKPDGDTES